VSRSPLSSTLILGGSGFLGVHVVEQAISRARARGAVVVLAGRESPTSPEFPASDSDGVARFEPFDARDAGAAERILDRVCPAEVIDCAALSRGGACESDPALATLLNRDLPALLASWCADGRARLIHISTDLVFGGIPPRPVGFTEEDPPAPLSTYGRSKAAGESAVLETDPAALVVRLPLLFGDSRGRALGASDSLLAAIDRGERPALFTDEYRTPLAVEEAAVALVALLDLDVAGLLHVAGPERVSRYRLGRLVLSGAGFSEEEIDSRLRPVRQAELNLVPPRPADVSLDSTRARELLGAMRALRPPSSRNYGSRRRH
jgi:dTDP-4-dehydrorhamnose reductase